MLQMQIRTQATTFKAKLSSNPCCKAIHFHALFLKIAKNNNELRHICSSLRPPLGMERLDFHWTDFYEISHLVIFQKYFEKIQVSLKSDKNNGRFT